MSYVNNTLLPGERVIVMGKVHWVVLMPGLCTMGLALLLIFHYHQPLLGFFIMAFGLYGLMGGLIHYCATELAVTDRRVIAKVGLIARTTVELNLNRVTSLTVDQTVMGRILNYGDIAVIGMGGTATPIRAISDPLTFRRYVLGEVQEQTDSNRL